MPDRSVAVDPRSRLGRATGPRNHRDRSLTARSGPFVAAQALHGPVRPRPRGRSPDRKRRSAGREPGASTTRGLTSSYERKPKPNPRRPDMRTVADPSDGRQLAGDDLDAHLEHSDEHAASSAAEWLLSDPDADELDPAHDARVLAQARERQRRMLANMRRMDAMRARAIGRAPAAPPCRRTPRPRPRPRGAGRPRARRVRRTSTRAGDSGDSDPGPPPPRPRQRRGGAAC